MAINFLLRKPVSFQNRKIERQRKNWKLVAVVLGSVKKRKNLEIPKAFMEKIASRS